MEKQIIVDKNDNIIGAKARADILPNDIYRVTCLWLRNSKGEVLLAQKSYNKKNDPGKWGPAVAGTVAENETYEENIKKEIFEELGVDDIQLTFGPKQFVETILSGKFKNRFFDQIFFGTTNRKEEDFKIQKEEVVKVRWINEEEFLKEVKEIPEKYISSVENMIKAIYGEST